MKLNLETSLYACGALAAVAGIGLGFAGDPLSTYAIFGWVGAALLGAAGLVARSPRWGTLGSAGIALSASLYLYWLKVRPSPGPALCSVNETIDCVSINDSPYSVVLNGSSLETPITLLGTGYFVGLLLATLSSADKAPRLYQISALFSIATLLTSLYLASVLFVEQKLCVFCIAIYLSNILILWAAFRGLAASEISLFDDLGKALRDRSLITIVACFVGVVVAGHVLYPNKPASPEIALEDQAAPEAKNRLLSVKLADYARPLNVAVEMHGAEPTKGATDPRYTLVEFADYACPHCRDATLLVSSELSKHPDVQVIFKDFPLTKECNPAFPPEAQSTFPQRCIPTLYAECARQQGKFWEVNRDIFQNQSMLSQTGFRADDLDVLVRHRGVDIEQLRPCLDDPETHRVVQLNGLSGARAGVHGTPAFYIKGIRDDGGWSEITMQSGPTDIFLLIAAHRAQNPLPSPAEPEPSHEPAEPEPIDDPADSEPINDPDEPEPSDEPSQTDRSEEG